MRQFRNCKIRRPRSLKTQRFARVRGKIVCKQRNCMTIYKMLFGSLPPFNNGINPARLRRDVIVPLAHMWTLGNWLAAETDVQWNYAIQFVLFQVLMGHVPLLVLCSCLDNRTCNKDSNLRLFFAFCIKSKCLLRPAIESKFRLCLLPQSTHSRSTWRDSKSKWFLLTPSQKTTQKVIVSTDSTPEKER